MKGNTEDIQVFKEIGVGSMHGDDFLNNKLDPDHIFDFDYFFTNMQYNLDPFLNDLNTSFDTFEN